MLSFNEYEEKKVQLQEGLKAEDYEAAIVIGWHKNNRKKIKIILIEKLVILFILYFNYLV